MGMRNDGQKTGERALVTRSGRVNTGFIPHTFKTLSRIVSSGASSVASTVRSAASAASAVVERDGETNHDQVSWAGFDKVELERGVTRQVLLLGLNHGFQVWDVESADNVCNLAASRHDISVSFMQMQPTPLTPTKSEDKLAHSRPLLIICADGSEDNSCIQEGAVGTFNGSVRQYNGSHVATVVWFYSLKSQSCVHLLRFRSVVHLVRCSCRVVCVLQSAQIHCLNAATLEREYTILTNPVSPGCYGSANMGLGPLAVGPRWMAYSGNMVVMTSSCRVNPQHLNSSCSFPSATLNGTLVAHYAKETSKQLAAGIATLGDMGCKKFLRYYSGILPDGKDVLLGTAIAKTNGVSGVHTTDADNVGMVIVRDIVQKNVVAQFRAHTSPISGLCFDPSGTLLLTASVKGHNINVFRIMPGQSENSTGASGPSYAHLYSLQRGFTDAVIQDISFSSDSLWIMVSTSRGTSHLFSISPSGGMVGFQSSDNSPDGRVNGDCATAKPVVHRQPNSDLQVLTPQSICESGPITLLAVSRIRNGSDGWRNAMNGAAAAATGRFTSLSGAIASVFHKCKGNDLQCDMNSLKKKYYLLVFSPLGYVIQYALHFSSYFDAIAASPGVSIASEPSLSCDGKLMVEAIQKWNICQKMDHKDRSNMDMYGENGYSIKGRVCHGSKNCENPNSFVSNIEEKSTTEEKQHMYISEAELQMHQNTNQLWLRSKIYFQLLLTDAFNEVEHDASSGGEIEIEKLPIRTLEARSKELIPVYNYLHSSKFLLGRMSFRNRKHNEQSQAKKQDISGSSKLLTQDYDENGLEPIVGSVVNTEVMETRQLDTVNTKEDNSSKLTSVQSRHHPNKCFGENDEFD